MTKLINVDVSRGYDIRTPSASLSEEFRKSRGPNTPTPRPKKPLGSVESSIQVLPAAISYNFDAVIGAMTAKYGPFEQV